MVWKWVGCIINSFLELKYRFGFFLCMSDVDNHASNASWRHKTSKVKDNTAAKAVLYFTYSSITQGYTFFCIVNTANKKKKKTFSNENFASEGSGQPQHVISMRRK